MIDFTYDLAGQKVYMERSRFLLKNIAKEAQGLILQAASNTARNAKIFAPKDTGFLKRSIQWRVRDRGLIGIVEALANYARWVEFGTESQRDQPFLGPAFDIEVAAFDRELRRIARRV